MSEINEGEIEIAIDDNVVKLQVEMAEATTVLKLL